MNYAIKEWISKTSLLVDNVTNTHIIQDHSSFIFPSGRPTRHYNVCLQVAFISPDEKHLWQGRMRWIGGASVAPLKTAQGILSIRSSFHEVNKSPGRLFIFTVFLLLSGRQYFPNPSCALPCPSLLSILLILILRLGLIALSSRLY